MNYNFDTKLETKKKEELEKSPYSIFGDNTAVLQTKHEEKKDHTLKIPIVENDSQIGLFKMDFQTGIILMEDGENNIVESKKLTKEQLARFTTMDPMAEKYYSISPYIYVMNNPMRYIDPDGMATHTDSLGVVIAVYNNDDMGVYKHNISADSYDGSELLAKNGTLMGSTDYWDEFSTEFSKGGESFTIQFGKSFDKLIESMHELSKGMDLKEIAAKSAGGALFDIKKDYINQGGLMNGKYVSSRSAGNYLAGYNASGGTYFGVSISFETFQKLAGALHIEESAGGRLTTSQKTDIILFGTYNSSNHNAFKARPGEKNNINIE